jgi:hypothetical protein
MGDKHRAQPSGNAQDKAAASGDGAAAQGGAVWDFRVELTRAGPNEDTLQLVLPLLLEHVEPEPATLLFQVCKAPWRHGASATRRCSCAQRLPGVATWSTSG